MVGLLLKLEVSKLLTGMAARTYFKLAVLKILKTVAFSQALLVAILFAKSVLPFIDVLLDHVLVFVIEPYIRLVWSSLTQWMLVYYISVPIPLILFIRHRLKGGRGFGKFFNNVLILLALIGLSQAFLLSSVVVSSTLPFLDLVADHCLCHIVMPYFQLLWNTLTSWISVYFSVVLIVVYNVHRMRKADREAQAMDCHLLPQNNICLPLPPSRPFCPRHFFPLFNDKLSFDGITDLCYQLIALEGGFNLEESIAISNLNSKGDRLMKMLILLENKANSQDLLARALKHLIQRSEQRNWYECLLEKVMKNDYAEELVRSACDGRSISSEVIDSVFHANYTDTDAKFGWPSKNDVIKFQLRRGWIVAELIGSVTESLGLPSQTEVVSPVFRIYTNPGSCVSLEVSHCMQSEVSNSSSSFSSSVKFAVMENCDSKFNSFMLKKCELLKCDLREGYGTLSLDQTKTENCSSLVGCIVMQREPLPNAGDSPTPKLQVQAPTPLCYTYSVCYQLECDGSELDIRHWKVHIVIYPDLLGFHESIVKSKFPSNEYLWGKQSKLSLEVVTKNLSLSVPPCSPRSTGWSFKQYKVIEENWHNMSYQHFILDVQWMGRERMSPKDFKQVFEWLGTSKRSELQLSLSPRKEYESLLFHTSTGQVSTSKSIWKKIFSKN